MEIFESIQRRFRARRMAEMARTVGLKPDTRVLDVGGTVDIWRLAPVMPRVVFLNQSRAQYEIGPAPSIVLGDGTCLPFADGSFDLVFSNSVIEHVGSREDQARFAAEIARVGRQYWVQTPNRRFPVEQHLWTPFIHWLPRPWQAPVLRKFSIWSAITRLPEDQRTFYIDHYLLSVRLLSAADLRRLFPNAQVLRERFLGWTKSLVAWGSNAKPELP
ncbi:MAG TPA: class I SAM-dependent methyltransferase [Bryobacteraceae bacterium]|nr:class I SAM-dependent methyltransferase [Bryobacteraceae bacterium]